MVPGTPTVLIPRAASFCAPAKDPSPPITTSPSMPENYNLPNALLTAFGAYFHRKIRFIPISFKPRQGGTNSINIRKIVKIGRQALHDFCEIQKAAAKKRG